MSTDDRQCTLASPASGSFPVNVSPQQTQPQSQQLAHPDTNLSLNEMLRVMDVAREMRNNREMAQRVLARDDVRATLRDKLKRSAQLTGDRVTDAEIDAAIDTYFADRHRYQDPKFSFSVLIAHLWIRRAVVLGTLAAVLMGAVCLWGMFFSPFAPWSPSRNAQRAVASRQADAQQLVEQIRAASLEPEVVSQAERLAAEIQAAGASDPATALSALETLRQLHQNLLEDFSIRIATDNDGSNLVERSVMENGGMVSGFYVLVEAVDASGKVIPRTIRNAEQQRDETVKIWGERIPFEVFERLRIDKQADRIMDETDFGVKERGRTQWRLTMPGSEGQPIKRSTQITSW